MFKAKRVDRNQAEIVDALRAIGATVITLHAVGEGVPDLLVGAYGKTHLLEIKNRTARGRLTPRQVQWVADWRGADVHIVYDVAEALAAVRGW